MVRKKIIATILAVAIAIGLVLAALFVLVPDLWSTFRAYLPRTNPSSISLVPNGITPNSTTPNDTKYEVIPLGSLEVLKEEGGYAVIEPWTFQDTSVAIFALAYPQRIGGTITLEMVLPDFDVNIDLVPASEEKETRWQAVQIEWPGSEVVYGTERLSQTFPAEIPVLISLTYTENATIATLNVSRERLRISNLDEEAFNNTWVHGHMAVDNPRAINSYGPETDMMYIAVEARSAQYFEFKIRLVETGG